MAQRRRHRAEIAVKVGVPVTSGSDRCCLGLKVSNGWKPAVAAAGYRLFERQASVTSRKARDHIAVYSVMSVFPRIVPNVREPFAVAIAPWLPGTNLCRPARSPCGSMT